MLTVLHLAFLISFNVRVFAWTEVNLFQVGLHAHKYNLQHFWCSTEEFNTNASHRPYKILHGVLVNKNQTTCLESHTAMLHTHKISTGTQWVLSIFSSNHYIHCFVFHRVPQRKLVPGNFLHPVFLVKFKMKQLLRALCFIVKALPRVQRSPPHHTKQCPIISTSPLRSSSDMLVKYVIH